MNPNDVVLTGPPRSGTTLTCELLNEAANTVALDEPMDAGPWLGKPASTAVKRVARLWGKRRSNDASLSTRPDPQVFGDLVERFYTDVRLGLLAGQGAVSKTVGGQVSGSKFADRRDRSGHREHLAQLSVMAVDKPLTEDFVLVVKHVAGFTAMLEQLVHRARCYAIVRNPLSTLSSWQTIGMPINNGRVPRGELLDPELKQTLDTIPDVIDRQFVILRWFYERFTSYLQPSSVIRYEEIVATGGRALAAISPSAAELDRKLDSRNRAAVYDRRTMKALGDRLLDEDGMWWQYYTRDSVRELMEGA